MRTKCRISAVAFALTLSASILAASSLTWAEPMQVIAAWPPVENHVSNMRIVLHGIRFVGNSDRTDQGTRAILDQAVEILARNPQALVFIASQPRSVSSNAQLRERRAAAVARYLEERGISPGRLVLLNSGQRPNDMWETTAPGQVATVELELAETHPACDNCSS